MGSPNDVQRHDGRTRGRIGVETALRSRRGRGGTRGRTRCLAAGRGVATRYELHAKVEGWQGRAPEAIEGTVNPTLNLRPGERYEFVWKNADGQPHNLALLDPNGSVLEETDFAHIRGATRNLTFTASEKMAQYQCMVHPIVMEGRVSLGDENRRGTV